MNRLRKKKRNHLTAAPPAVWRRLLLPAAIALVVVVGSAAGIWWSGSHTPFAKLTGKWQRPDGGYTVDVTGVDPGGKMDAAYFNPKPIHVAKAQASLSNEIVCVFIELRDINYPGSTYHLKYDAKNDRLEGIYFQAALGQTFDVYFERVPR